LVRSVDILIGLDINEHQGAISSSLSRHRPSGFGVIGAKIGWCMAASARPKNISVGRIGQGLVVSPETKRIKRHTKRLHDSVVWLWAGTTSNHKHPLHIVPSWHWSPSGHLSTSSSC
jgi:hypothetical protein